jgi:SAM-dependent methyltransferase
MAPRKTKQIAEFGDFQTPDGLAHQVLSLLKRLGLVPASIVEPSCGLGAFLAAAAATYPQAELFGLDINPNYLSVARERLAGHSKLTLTHESFFRHNWMEHVADLPSPLLVLGNPPWVTNAELGLLGSDNLPTKSNFQNMKGLDAVTGKSNFDISEWMLLQNLEWLRVKNGALAVLCKTAVARKILASAWKRNIAISDARIYRIDALSHFNAAVEACLLVIQVDGQTASTECAFYSDLESDTPSSRIGFTDHALVSDIETYSRYQALRGVNPLYTWRSGIKHDCAKVMELHRTAEGLINGHGQRVNIEDTYLYPLVKSSDIAGARKRDREMLVIVTQKVIGEDTGTIKTTAPRTWAYLQEHRAALEGRTSVIYRNKPDFSVFGVGDYSFAPWKIAISGLYKKLAFRIYGSQNDKPTFFDDTVYFLPFYCPDEAQSVLEMLNSPQAQGFLTSMIFWDEKRPITVELLKRIDIVKLAGLLGRSHELSVSRSIRNKPTDAQGSLFMAQRVSGN